MSVPRALLDALSDETAKGFAILSKRIAALEARLAAAEERATKAVVYQGIWQRAASYTRGDGVTHQGAFWVCTAAETTAQPGSSSAWQLTTKTGSGK